MQLRILNATLCSRILREKTCLQPSVNVFKNRKISSSSQELMNDSKEADQLANRSVIDKVNRRIELGPGRLFAVIQILGKQYRVTDQDIVVIERNWPPKQNDKLSFEKVLLVGSSSFTLIGKPILPKNLVKVSGTIVHKDLTHTKMRYFYIPKERVHNLNFVREELTYIRINKVELYPKVNILEDVEYSPSRI